MAGRFNHKNLSRKKLQLQITSTQENRATDKAS